MRILCYILVVLFVTTSAVGQQINPVPDYIFRNSMSVGRNAPTDTSAYFSIGPRFGATRGFMPPMVVDTAAVTGTKRNGLLIYSIQRNSYLYWDSTGMRWSRIAANLDTLLLSTRAWRQKGIDSVASVRIGGSGVTGYIPKFTAARTLDSSQIFQTGGNIGIGTTTVTVASNQRVLEVAAAQYGTLRTSANNKAVVGSFVANSDVGVVGFGSETNHSASLYTNNIARLFVQANGRIGVNTSADNGYQFDINGDLRTVNGANIATTSGNLVIGATGAGSYKTDITGTLRSTDAAYFATTTGNLGVGTTSVTNAANQRVVQVSAPQYATFRASANNGVVQSDYIANNESALAAIGTTTNHPFNIYTNNATRFNVQANGRVGVNTSVDAGYQFDVAGTMRGTTMTINTSGQNSVISNRYPSGGNGANMFVGSDPTSIGGGLSAWNTSVGVSTMGVTSGYWNTSIGWASLASVGAGFQNTAVGASAMQSHSGSNSTAVGYRALFSNTSGSGNVAVGSQALNNNTTGFGLTAIGGSSMFSANGAYNSVAIGEQSMYSFTSGYGNVGIGQIAMYGITSGFNNVGIGQSVLQHVGTGANNIGFGTDAGKLISNGNNNNNPSSSIYIGTDSRPSGSGESNQIVIGNSSRGNGSNTTTIGNSSTTTTFLFGSLDVGTIDSSASPINMLWANNNGVINKTAPPAFMVSSNATTAASWNFARDVTNSGNISRVTRTQDNAGDTTVTFHIAVYIATASFTTGSWVEVATLPTGYRPNEVVYGSLPDFVSGDVYEAQNGTDFAADAEYTGATVFRVLKDGKVQVRVATVTSSVTLSGTNNVLFPISFTFTIRPISV